MKNLRLAAVMFALVIVFAAAGCEEKSEVAAPAPSGGINWMSYDDGMAKASAEGMPVMIDFYTTWCKYCVMLDETTYKDAEVISTLNEHFVAIKVDAESQDKVTDKGKSMTKQELAASYKVSGYPTIWFLDGKGEPIGPVPGYSGPEEFRPILTFISSGAYGQGIEYSDYLSSLKDKKQE